MIPEEIALEAVTRAAYNRCELDTDARWAEIREFVRCQIEAGNHIRKPQYEAVLWALEQERAGCAHIVESGARLAAQGGWDFDDCARAIKERGQR